MESDFEFIESSLEFCGITPLFNSTRIIQFKRAASI
jgi:hypothetical protein